jgi:hypothetical protein
VRKQYLLPVGRGEEAITALTFIAARNGKPPKLTKAELELVDPGLGRGAFPSGSQRKNY